MAPSSSTRRARRRPVIPFPQLPPERTTPDAQLWRVLWLRAMAQYFAVEQHMGRIWSRKTTTEPLRVALASLWHALSEDIKDHFANLVAAGVSGDHKRELRVLRREVPRQ